MTKSTITREQLLEIIENDHVQCGEASYLARMVLAAMDSDPVGKPFMYGIADPDGNAYIDEFCVSDDLGLVEDTVNELNYDREEGDELNYSVVALYRHAQPAPVLPDEVTAEDCPAFVEYEVAEVDEAWSRGFNACRAAMLATAPQSPGGEPATVPGKWIPVSERMPEVGDIVLTAMGGVVNVGEMECSAANCRFFTSVISGRELPATHWMPLPAAPQEVNRE
ncbi:TPA: DUF551 domain-containing protein [Klebsiella pneumoniae]